MTRVLWLIRRELWENAAIWILPALIGAVLLLAALFGDVDLRASAVLPPPDQPQLGGAIWLFGFGMVFFFAMELYSAWYLLDCLYADRKDRSILFWRALPLSDVQVVLSKLLVALVVVPLVGFIAADISTLGMAVALTVRESSQPLRALLWNPQHWLQLQVLWLYLLAATDLWYLPIAAWLLVISAWARKSTALWATMPIVVPFLIERWLLHTQFIGTLVANRLTGLVSVAFHNNADEAFSLPSVVDKSRGLTLPGQTVWELINPRGLLESPATWIGLLLGLALIASAIELRRRHMEV